MSEQGDGTTATAQRTAPPQSTGSRVLREITSSSGTVVGLAMVLALVVGALLIIAVDEGVQSSATYLFARPADFFSAAWAAVRDAYVALFQGAVFDARSDTTARQVRPLTETLTVATPLILAGLGIGVGFRAGMFNIGAQGQVLVGAAVAGWLGFTFVLPVGLHLVLCVLGGVLGGAIWAGVAGALKARTGAHEVIVTIMLNYVALYLVAYLLTTAAFTREGSNEPRSPAVAPGAGFPLLLGEQFRLHAGFLLALAAAVGVWWLMSRSTLGFRFRAVGANPAAARTAGISVPAAYLGVMVVSGALVGMAGATQVLGTERVLTGGIAGTIGFDAITVALLGRSRPLGTVLAGLLFGALATGGRVMEVRTGTPIDIVAVVQSLIVLFIAAPPLVRAVFRLPTPRVTKEVAA